MTSNADLSVDALMLALKTTFDADRSAGLMLSVELRMGEDRFAAVRAAYAGEVSLTDRWIGHLLEAVRELGLMDDTLIVFTSDHGESLYDRSGYIGHGHKLYDEEVIVPLFFFAPSELPGGRVIREPVETIHIAPTILDFLGLPPEPSFQGMSLGDIIGLDGRDDARPRHPLEEKPAFSMNGIGRMVRFGGWKYEVSNQDHSFMQGAELAGRLVRGTPEVTYLDPARANSGEFLAQGR